MTHVLVIEDDADLLDDLLFCLRHEGLDAHGLTGSRDLEASLREMAVDVLVLDLVLPGEDGLTIAQRLRKTWPALGIVMLSCRDTTQDRITGLDAGADIYLSKTAQREELVASILAVARRVGASKTDALPWQLQRARRVLVLPTGQEILLTTQEYRLLHVFAQSTDGCASRDALIEGLGEKIHDYDPRRLETLVSRLRHKLKEQTGSENVIRSQRNEGYLFAWPLRHVDTPS